jgi:nitroimidazol reductase NimA-like FMN-containing flavoprotein (pyridoxamine 5'-phosphate oxidase superfamily)
MDYMASKHLWDDIRGLFESQPLAVLSSDCEGAPYSNLVAFAATEDLKGILFATTRASRKYRNIEANSAVCLLVDNRSNDPADFHRAMAVTALGSVDLQSTTDEKLNALFLSRHPHLCDFLASPTVSLLMLNVDRYILVQRFQDVKVLRP